jgi:hypothetical protein
MAFNKGSAGGPNSNRRQPRSVVDADRDEFPADAVVAVDRTGISPSDAMSNRADPAELLDIEVDVALQSVAFVASGRFSPGSKALSLFSPSRRRTRLTVADETPIAMAICSPVQRCRRRSSISLTVAWGVGCHSR